MKNTLTKIGLTGNSGVFPCATSSTGNVVESVGFLHINAPYDSNGRVFVETEDMGWARVPKKTAKRHNLTIIRCYVCESPAVRLDHLWPYHNEMTCCKDHLSWYSDWMVKPKKHIGNLCRVSKGKMVPVKSLIG